MVLSVVDVIDQAKSLVPFIGVPGAMLLVFIFALHKKWVCLGRELDFRDELNKGLTKERDEWREEARQNNHQADRATGIADRAANVAEKAVNSKGKEV